jgi:hypothetical protein
VWAVSDSDGSTEDTLRWCKEILESLQGVKEQDPQNIQQPNLGQEQAEREEKSDDGNKNV